MLVARLSLCGKIKSTYDCKRKTRAWGNLNTAFVSRSRSHADVSLMSDAAARAAMMFPGSLLLPAGLFLTGWTARGNIHWILPDIVRRLLPKFLMSALR